MAPLCVLSIRPRGVPPHNLYIDVCGRCHSTKGELESRRDDTATHPGHCAGGPLSYNSIHLLKQNKQSIDVWKCWLFFPLQKFYHLHASNESITVKKEISRFLSKKSCFKCDSPDSKEPTKLIVASKRNIVPFSDDFWLITQRDKTYFTFLSIWAIRVYHLIQMTKIFI